jgi:hypothetical protein
MQWLVLARYLISSKGNGVLHAFMQRLRHFCPVLISKVNETPVVNELTTSSEFDT